MRKTTLLFPVVMLVQLQGCLWFKASTPKEWLDKTAALKAQVEQIALSPTPLTKQAYEVTRDYFAAATEPAAYLAANPDSAKKFGRELYKMGISSLCDQIFVDAKSWQSLMKKCERNGFFLCAEEVRSYSDAMSFLQANLDGSAKEAFDEARTCPKFGNQQNLSATFEETLQ